MSPEEIVEAIWACWEKHLGDWDLEGSVANAQARRLAVEAVADLNRLHSEGTWDKQARRWAVRLGSQRIETATGEPA